MPLKVALNTFKQQNPKQNLKPYLKKFIANLKKPLFYKVKFDIISYILTLRRSDEKDFKHGGFFSTSII